MKKDKNIIYYIVVIFILGSSFVGVALDWVGAGETTLTYYMYAMFGIVPIVCLGYVGFICRELVKAGAPTWKALLAPIGIILSYAISFYLITTWAERM